MHGGTLMTSPFCCEYSIPTFESTAGIHGETERHVENN